jgi:MerR family transcriptional regulator/heat shock protein HspR
MANQRHEDSETQPDRPSAGSPAGEPATESGEATAGTWFVSAVAAQRAGVHEQTLRHYERIGLITPARKSSKPHSPRLYSAWDIARVVHIRELMGDLGVNLAGVETILRMRDRMDAMRREMADALARLTREHEEETRRLHAIIDELRQ